MKSHISAAVQPLHLVAHVFEQQLVLVQVHFQPAAEEAEQELHPGSGDDALRAEEVTQVTSLVCTSGTGIGFESHIKPN